jgi:succinoglycan biosynthesis protein ExoA
MVARRGTAPLAGSRSMVGSSAIARSLRPVSDRTISVVMPVRNEADTIVAAVESIFAQEVDARLEVVVADAMSTDGTRDRLADLGRRFPQLVVVDNHEGRTPSGLNRAIAASRGDVVVRCDAHSEFPPGYIARAVELLDASGAANVGGVQRAVGLSPMQRAIAVGMTTPLGVGDARFHRGGPPGPVDTVYLGVFRRSALSEVGGFDESLVRNQDYELNHRLRAAGHTVYFDPGLEVVYRPRASLRALASQYFQYGRWKRVMVRRNPSSLRWRQLVPPLFVLALVASGIALLAGSPLGLFVPALYAAAVTGSTVVEAVRRRDGAILGLALVLPVMHIVWGLGFLIGMRDADLPRVPDID